MPTNRPPVAQDQSVTTPQDTPVAITLRATDPDNDRLTYDLLSTPRNGTLSGNGNVRTYTPNPGYSGTDSFTFTATDGRARSNVATVIITVTPTQSRQRVIGSGVLRGNNGRNLAFSINVTQGSSGPPTGSLVVRDGRNEMLNATRFTSLSASGASATITGSVRRGRMTYNFSLVVNDSRRGSGIVSVQASNGFRFYGRVISGTLSVEP